MRFFILTLLAALFVMAAPAYAEGPSAEDKQSANKTFGDYMTTLHGDTPEKAYSLLADVLKAEMTADKWTAQMSAMNESTGKSLGHAGIAAKWYKDPPGKPPGIYVAYSFESGYEKVPVMHETVALQRAPDGRFFVVGHSKDIGKEQPSVDEIMADLRGRADVTFEDKDGWTVATSEKEKTIWSFTQEGHPAHPAVAQRAPVEENGQIFLRMELTCGAAKEACDRLAADFEALNRATIEKSKVSAP